MCDIILRKKLPKYDRIALINRQIQDIEKTIYPDHFAEVRETMLVALRDQIDAILDGRV